MNPDLEALDEAITQFRAATQLPAYQRRILAGLGLRGVSSIRVLRAVERLVRDGEAASIGQVAAAVGVEHSTASRSAEALVQEGLLSKQVSPEDRRCNLLTLTSQGRSALRAATAHRQEALKDVVREWSPADMRTLTRLLHRLQASFEEEFQAP